jgi:hypothetical protein
MIVKPAPILEEPIPPEKNDTTGKGIIGEEEPLRLPFVMFGDRQAAYMYIDEVMSALVLLKDKAPTWYE